MKNLRAFHTLCSRKMHTRCNLCMQDFDILTMILSALYWKKNNGNIDLIADEENISYVKSKCLETLWDNIYEIPNYDINREMFWAGGKIFALREQKTPIAMIDTDMIVWSDISTKLNEKIVAIHNEPLIPEIYKVKEYFKMKKGNFEAKILDQVINLTIGWIGMYILQIPLFYTFQIKNLKIFTVMKV